MHSANLKCCFGFFFFVLQGVKDYSVPVGLDGKAQVDLVVVGSVAVSEKGKEKIPAEKFPVQCQEGHTTWQSQIYPWSSAVL